jgi:hypothetical protein
MPATPEVEDSASAKWRFAVLFAIFATVYIYVPPASDASINAFICTSPIPGVPWVNLAAILVCAAASISILHSLLPFMVSLVTTLFICSCTAYVVFMCVMGIMGPPETKEQVMHLVSTLVHAPVHWLNPRPTTKRWPF